MGAGYIADGVTAAIGVIRILGGAVVSVFGGMVESFGDVIKMAKKLPSALQPKWLLDFSDGTEALGRKIQNLGNEIVMNGADKLDQFGSTAEKWEKMFQGWQGDRARKVATEISKNNALLSKPAATTPDLKPSGGNSLSSALLKGSSEEYEVLARFSQSGQSDKDKIQKEQLTQMKKVEAATLSVVDAIKQKFPQFAVI